MQKRTATDEWGPGPWPRNGGRLAHASAAAVAVAAALLVSAAAEGQTMQCVASVTPQNVRPADTFSLVVQVVQWLPGTGTPQAPTVSWPDWKAIGVTTVRAPAATLENFPVGNQVLSTATYTVGLRAATEGTVTLPAMAVRGTAGATTTFPLTVTVSAQAPPPGSAAAVPQPAPVMPQGPPPGAMGSPPWWQDQNVMSPAPPPEVTPQAESPVERLQYAAGSAAFLVVVIVLAIKLARSGRRTTINHERR